MAFMLLCAAFSVQAQDMKSLWQTMPKHFTPYLDDTNRRNLVDGGNGHVVVDNQLGEQTQLDTLTANFMQIQLNKAVTWQLKVLQTTDGKPVVCSVKTFRAPESESCVMLFDEEWNQIHTVDIKHLADSLLQKPDTMDQAKYSELMESVPFVSVEATLSPSTDTLLLKPHAPMTSKENEEALKKCLLQKMLKWNGKTFK